MRERGYVESPVRIASVLKGLAAWTYALILERWGWRTRRAEAAAWLLAAPGGA